jgi:hypothetical protein
MRVCGIFPNEREKQRGNKIDGKRVFVQIGLEFLVAWLGGRFFCFPGGPNGTTSVLGGH